MDDAQVVQEQEQECIDITISNVVCSFSVRCHLDLKTIALNGANVEFRKDKGMVIMKIRKPLVTANMWSSGKITCIGATSEEFAKVAARRFTRILQKIGFKVKLRNYRVVNVLGTCSMPFGVNLNQFAQNDKKSSYEPEIHCAVNYKFPEIKASIKIFSTGSITITAPSVNNVQRAVEGIYPIVFQYKKPLDPNRRKPPPPQIEDIDLAENYQPPIKKMPMSGGYTVDSDEDENVYLVDDSD